MSDRPLLYLFDADPAARQALIRVADVLALGVCELDMHGSLPAPGDLKDEGCIVADLDAAPEAALALVRAEAARGGLPVILTTANAPLARCVAAIQAGAADVLTRPLHAPLLLESVMRVLERDRVAIPRRRARRAWEETLQSLSRSQRQTLAALVSAPDLAALAAQLRISTRAAEYRLTVLLRKLGLASRMILWQRLATDAAFREAVLSLAPLAASAGSLQPSETLLASAGCS